VVHTPIACYNSAKTTRASTNAGGSGSSKRLFVRISDTIQLRKTASYSQAAADLAPLGGMMHSLAATEFSAVGGRLQRFAPSTGA